MRKRIVTLIISCCILVAGGCGQAGLQPNGGQSSMDQSSADQVFIDQRERPKEPVLLTDMVQQVALQGLASLEQQKEESGTKMLAEGINGFGLEFFGKLNTEENQFFSPYSICTALSILDVGAGSRAKEELEGMLGISDLPEWNRQMKGYMEKEWSKDTRLLTANSLWLDFESSLSETVEEDFLAPVLYYYGGQVFEADFKSDGENVAKHINAWVEEHTDSMIKDFKKEVDPNTTMSIINAVFFEGKWEYPFKGEDTRADGSFLNIDGERERDVPMMKQESVSLRYFETEDFQAVELPYKDSTLAMDILLPSWDTDISCYHSLSVEEQDQLWKALSEASKKEISTLSIPAFSMDISVEGMKGILKEMGMVSAFLEHADLDRIGEAKYVQDVSHRAKIEVCEEGTRAAAVTDVMMADSAAPIEETNFVANRPFLYAIRDTETGIILFLGQVVSLK